MITEDYVSFETAKLLKEKGFDEPTTKSYYTEDFENPMIFSHDLLSCIQTDEFLCPTLQMAMKWLREVHNIHITMAIENNGNYIGYLYRTTGANIQGWDKRLSKTSYEEACEAAIKYCLEKLI